MRSRVLLLLAAVLVGALGCGAVHAQQFNSDNYLAKPHGVGTIILTTGQQTTMWMTTFSLIPNWEFTAAAYLYNKDGERKTGEGYSTSLYAKWMLYENKAKTGGVAWKFGTGVKPSYFLDGDGFKSASQTYWTNVPITLAFLDNTLSWDLMPGASYTKDYGEEKKNVTAFTYSTRLAWYPWNPEWALVGEVFGATGSATLKPEYRVGIRWEPNVHTNIALTYGRRFDGSPGSGLEIGVMFFTPPFACFSGCR